MLTLSPKTGIPHQNLGSLDLRTLEVSRPDSYTINLYFILKMCTFHIQLPWWLSGRRHLALFYWYDGCRFDFYKELKKSCSFWGHNISIFLPFYCHFGESLQTWLKQKNDINLGYSPFKSVDNLKIFSNHRKSEMYVLTNLHSSIWGPLAGL